MLLTTILTFSLLLITTKGYEYCMSSWKLKIGNRFLPFSSSSDNIERELELFFEKSAEQGIENVRKLTLTERVARVKKGEQLENEIFSIRARILEIEEAMMSDANEDFKMELEDLREHFDTLKYEYQDVVCASSKDVPLYFGRVPDAFQ